MQLILWRHAQAEDTSNACGDPRQRDLARELTNKGEKQAKLTAQWLRPRLPPGAVVLASPAIRTVQTAQQLSPNVERVAGLAPDVEPRSVLELVGWPGRGMDERTVVIVGHQPTLGRIASILLTGGMERDIGVRKSAAWWFECSSRGEMSGVSLRAVFDAGLG